MAMQHLWGRYFEDFTVGEVIKHWPGRTIRDFDDTWFTLLTMNTNPIHFDDHFASQSQYGRCLVNGTLVFSIVVGMSVRDISQTAIANLEYEFVRHLGPTFHGDTLYAESEILEKTESTSKHDRGVLRRDTRGRPRRADRAAAPPRPAPRRSRPGAVRPAPGYGVHRAMPSRRRPIRWRGDPAGPMQRRAWRSTGWRSRWGAPALVAAAGERLAPRGSCRSARLRAPRALQQRGLCNTDEHRWLVLSG
jgi:acyl dehydratase